MTLYKPATTAPAFHAVPVAGVGGFAESGEVCRIVAAVGGSAAVVPGGAVDELGMDSGDPGEGVSLFSTAQSLLPTGRSHGIEESAGPVPGGSSLLRTGSA
ncbi:hypothetical protein [Nocardia sp. NPDC051750]|uniref:hypothetical protein n=1 Tax=Nocardia sp. NPDC051750 TaxID=3364325 RepID=UPI0037AB7949